MNATSPSPTYRSINSLLYHYRRRNQRSMQKSWLAVLPDIHVWLHVPSGRYFYTFRCASGYDGGKNHVWQGRYISVGMGDTWTWLPADNHENAHSRR